LLADEIRSRDRIRAGIIVECKRVDMWRPIHIHAGSIVIWVGYKKKRKIFLPRQDSKFD
jgi:hypothetical protein